MNPYIFENSKKEKIDAEFGKLTVPENRTNPNSRLIELTFVRFKSTSPNPGSPIIYLAGGPGGSGISAARGNRFPLSETTCFIKTSSVKLGVSPALTPLLE